MKSFKLNKILLAFPALALAFGCLLVSGKTSTANVVSADEDASYYFESIGVDIEVTRDKQAIVTETLEAVWTKSRTSLIRDIQRVSATTRIVDGKEIKGKDYYAGISDISVKLDGGKCDWSIIGKDDDFYLSDFYSIEMKKPDGTTLERDVEHVFELSYVYDMSDDVVRGVEDFTFDVLGYDMATVKKFTAKITFPEGTVLDDVSFRTNKKREWVPSPHEGEYVNCTGNIIELCAYPMAAEKGYTVQVILPAGFYNPATVKVTFYWYYVIFAVLAAAGIAAGLIIFLKRSVQKKPVEVVEFYPPEYVDIMKYSGIWHRGARSKDAAALVLKWVDMGFIKLERDGKRHITLYTTGKDTDGRDSRGKLYCETAEEAEFYRALFRYEGNVFHTRGYFFNNCKSGIYDAVEKLVKRSGKPVEDVETIKTVLPFVSLVPTFAFLMYNAILTGPSKGFIGYFLPVFFFIFMAAGTFTGVIFAKSPNLLILLFPIAFYGMIYTVYSFLFSMPRYDYICLRYIAPLWWALNVFVLPFLLKGKRTREVQTLYGRMLGFKRFLLTAELPRIQLLFDENPEYFSDILPYCLIMGISKKVKKRFAALDFALPALMQSGMNERWFCYCVARTTSHSSFSVAGGGGFSGGGGGGGGHGGSSGGGGGGGGSRSR